MGNMLWGCPTWGASGAGGIGAPNEASALKVWPRAPEIIQENFLLSYFLFSVSIKVDAHDRAVLELKVQRDRLEEYKIKVKKLSNIFMFDCKFLPISL